MKTWMSACLGGALSVATLWCLPQEPGKPPPAPAPASTAQAPAETKVPAPSPLEGVYALRTRTKNGVPEVQRSRGYVAITRRHLLICLVAPGADPELPLVRAGVRTWKKQEELVHTEIELGFYTDAGGAIHLEEHGKKEPRRIELVRGLLRIWQDARDYLEFERIE